MVVGAGFGGLAAAHALARMPVEVVVVDAQNHHTFQPLLYQVATAALNAADIAQSVRGMFHDRDNVDFRLGRVCGLDADRRQVELEGQTPLSYDYLVLAAGATTGYFGIPGVEEHALPLKSLSDALTLRNHLLLQFERAAADPSLVDEGALTVVIVGGGPTGVELAGAIAELRDHVLAKDFPDLDVSRSRIVLVEATDRLLGTFHPRSAMGALHTLRSRGVEVLLDTAVESADPGRVCLAGTEEIATRTMVWAAGVRPSPLADVLGLERGPGGRIVVGADLRVSAHPEVFVIGDLAASHDRSGKPYPQLAPVAIQGGRHAARQIGRLLDGRGTERFRYRDRGTMATIGRNAAVAELPLGLRFRGRVAWLMWLALHLVMLIGFRNRASVLLNWSWNYLTYDRGARLIVNARPLDRGPRPGPG